MSTSAKAVRLIAIVSAPRILTLLITARPRSLCCAAGHLSGPPLSKPPSSPASPPSSSPPPSLQPSPLLLSLPPSPPGSGFRPRRRPRRCHLPGRPRCHSPRRAPRCRAPRRRAPALCSSRPCGAVLASSSMAAGRLYRWRHGWQRGRWWLGRHGAVLTRVHCSCARRVGRTCVRARPPASPPRVVGGPSFIGWTVRLGPPLGPLRAQLWRARRSTAMHWRWWALRSRWRASWSRAAARRAIAAAAAAAAAQRPQRLPAHTLSTRGRAQCMAQCYVSDASTHCLTFRYLKSKSKSISSLFLALDHPTVRCPVTRRGRELSIRYNSITT